MGIASAAVALLRSFGLGAPAVPHHRGQTKRIYERITPKYQGKTPRSPKDVLERETKRRNQAMRDATRAENWWKGLDHYHPASQYAGAPRPKWVSRVTEAARAAADRQP